MILSKFAKKTIQQTITIIIPRVPITENKSCIFFI